MNLDTFLAYALRLPATEETLPFGPETLVFKVAGKLFALTPLDGTDFRLNLKCDPQRAIELREQYPDVIVPGWHMNKRHWNTVYVEQGGLADKLVEELIDHSYTLVVNRLTRKLREEHGL